MRERIGSSKRVDKAMGGARGFTLIEVLVSMVLSGIALGVVATDFSHQAHTRLDMDQVAETQQALMATNTFVTQELRQAGACLPELGNFVAIAGANNGERDVLTLRIGTITPGTLVCRRSILTAGASASSAQLNVADAAQFKAGGYIYVTRAAGNGSMFRIASISGNVITVQGTLGATFIAGGGVYGVEERKYEVVEMDGEPVLTLAIDGAAAQPMVRGVTRFDVKYRTDPCPPCVSVDLPSNNEAWRTVREIELNVAVQSMRNLASGERLVLDTSTSIRPRNLS